MPKIKAVKVNKVEKTAKKWKSKKAAFVKNEPSQSEEAIAVLEETSVSPAEIDKTPEPTLIRLSKNFGTYGGSLLGGILGSRIGFASEGAKLGTQYGGKIASYGVKKLIERMPLLGSFKKGGHVKKTGAYLLHKGEKVIPAHKKPCCSPCAKGHKCSGK